MKIQTKDFISFDEWFLQFVAQVRKDLGYIVQLNKEASRPYFLQGMTPCQAADDILAPPEQRAWDGNKWRIQ